ncbi:MAG: GYD domain-containing protein, partial [Deltaproteobacteria bacterium]|nr:GYD domain-containing protein [Deltaproteobacteria bacterium]
MPKYMIQASYVGEGLKGLIKEGGTKRREEVARVIESMGGKLESFYYAFGDYDVVGVAE